MMPEATQRIIAAVSKGKHGYATLKVVTALGPFFRRDTGELLCSKETLAKTAHVSGTDIDHALARLVELGVLVQEEGIYYVQPYNSPRLTLVEGGKAD